MKILYVASDGKQFDSEKDARQHEFVLKSALDDKFQKFLNRNAGKELLKKHSLDEFGIWEVRGEDPNADLHGHHHNPYLFTAKGRLINVIKKAIITDNFWSWGGGGQIKKIVIIEL